MSGTIFLARTELSIDEWEGSTFVEIRRSGPTDSAVTVTYGVTADTATPGVDFVASSGTVTIAAGADRAFVPVTVINDRLGEATEVFSLALISAQGAELAAPRTIRISILDEETPAPPPAEEPLVSGYEVRMTPVVNAGLWQPLRFAFSPTDPTKLFIAEKDGVVKVADTDDGTVTTLLNFTDAVNRHGDRGLLGIALHPDLAKNPYLYLFYVVDPAETGGLTGAAGRDGDGNRYAHLVRHTLDAATGHTTVVPNSAVVLLGGAGQKLADTNGAGALDFTEPEFAALPSSERFAGVTPAKWVGGFKQDYIKLDSNSHGGGALVFGPDGALYVATGDGTSYNYADPRTPDVMSLDSLSGKILRIDPITGNGLADNPFVTQGMDLDDNRAKVFQLGLRNPFSFALAPDGRTVLGDVGWWSFEEVNAGGPGANFGWPWFEGGDGADNPTVVYRNTPAGQAFYEAIAAGLVKTTSPLRSFSHDSAAPGIQMQAVIGGSVVYTGNRYPAEFRNDFFFSDFVTGRVFSVDVDRPEELRFLTQVPGRPGPIHMMQGPDGFIWYADIVTGQVGRLEIAPLSAAQSWQALGAGSPLADGVWQLTPPGPFATGGVAGTTRLDLRQDLRIAFEVFQASAPGQDGFALVLHADPRGAAALGHGELGLSGLQMALALAFQTWQGPGGPAAHDHGRLLNPNDATFGAGQVEPIDLGRIDDGTWHRVELSWDADSQTLTWSWDGVVRDTLRADLAAAVFGGSSFVHVALTAAGGAATPDQRVRALTVDGLYQDVAGNQAPVVFGGATRTLSVAENMGGIFHLPRASDAEGDAPAWRIAGGADAARFAIDPASGALSFRAAPDFEAPSDTNRDNIYEVVIEAADPSGATGRQTIAVRVTDQVVEVIRGTAAADTLRGTSQAEVMIGGAGNDRLLAGSGDDTVLASTGDGHDSIAGAGGIDTYSLEDTEADAVASLASRRATSAETGNDTLSGIENLVGGAGNDSLAGDAGANRLLGGSGADTINGGDGDDSIEGGNGDDRIDGGPGADVMAGGRGNTDRYWVDDEDDEVIEAANGGYDTVNTIVDHALSAHVERLAMLGTANLSGWGNDLANLLNGNAGANLLLGLDGADTITGGDGADTIDGGTGADRLSGNAGADSFRFASATHGRDRITDYVGAEDTLLVSAAGFGGGLAAGMNLVAAGRYVENLTGLATAPAGTAQFTYETDTFILRWDPDGRGGTAATMIADLRGVTGWTGAELVVIA